MEALSASTEDEVGPIECKVDSHESGALQTGCKESLLMPSLVLLLLWGITHTHVPLSQ